MFDHWIYKIITGLRSVSALHCNQLLMNIVIGVILFNRLKYTNSRYFLFTCNAHIPRLFLSPNIFIWSTSGILKYIF